MISPNNLIQWTIKGARSYLLWSMALMLIFCAGCVTQDLPSFNYAPDDQNKAAKDTVVPAGKALIFVLDREAPHTSRFAKMAQTTLQVDQRDVCRLANNTFYRTVLDPGRHQLALRFEGNWADASPDAKPIRIEKELLVDLEPDHVYYFRGSLDTQLEPTGLLLTGLENRMSIYLQKEPAWIAQHMITQGTRIRLTGELIGP